MKLEDKDFKIGLLQEFWNRRNRDLVPPSAPGTGVKKQKFMVLYNLIAKTMGEPHTLANLKAFEEGPVYYDIYSHIMKTNEFLEQKSIEPQNYNEDILNATLRMIESESYTSLSEITHALDLWSSNYDPEYNENIINEDFKYNKNNIDPEDITDKDNNILKVLYEYNLNLYNNYVLESMHGKICAIEKKNKEKIIEILSSEDSDVREIFDELSQIDTLAKINYDENHTHDRLGGVLIDI